MRKRGLSAGRRQSYFTRTPRLKSILDLMPSVGTSSPRREPQTLIIQGRRGRDQRRACRQNLVTLLLTPNTLPLFACYFLAVEDGSGKVSRSKSARRVRRKPWGSALPQTQVPINCLPRVSVNPSPTPPHVFPSGLQVLSRSVGPKVERQWSLCVRKQKKQFSRNRVFLFVWFGLIF